MRNYSYKMIDEEYIISEAEHKYCQEQIEKGKSVISLRGGEMGINLAMIKSWNETDKLTKVEERKKDDVLKLQGQKDQYDVPENYDEQGNYRPRMMKL